MLKNNYKFKFCRSGKEFSKIMVQLLKKTAQDFEIITFKYLVKCISRVSPYTLVLLITEQGCIVIAVIGLCRQSGIVTFLIWYKIKYNFFKNKIVSLWKLHYFIKHFKVSLNKYIYNLINSKLDSNILAYFCLLILIILFEVNVTSF